MGAKVLNSGEGQELQLGGGGWRELTSRQRADPKKRALCKVEPSCYQYPSHGRQRKS
jgi:hypothetical protein